jgi:hypothetical protein
MEYLTSFLLIFFAIFGCVTTQELGSTINARGNWENGITGTDSWLGIEWARPNVSIQLVTAPVRQGKYAARFEVTPADYINSGERAEVSGLRNATGSVDRRENVPGSVFFYAFSSYLPSPFVSGTSWTILLQMHGPNSWPYSGASPSFAVSAQNIYSIHVNGGAKNGTKNNRNAEYEFSDSEIVLDSWEDFVFEIKWDIENKAYVNGWRRRWGQGEKQFTQVLRVTNESTLMYDWNLLVNGNGTGTVRDAHYWKHGVYRGRADETPNATVAILDGFTRALTFDDAVYGAFGDVPATPITSPSAAPEAVGPNASPVSKTPSSRVTSSAAKSGMSLVSAASLLLIAMW